MDTAICPSCRASFRVAEKHRGKKFRCANCGAEFQHGVSQVASSTPPVAAPVTPVVVKPTVVAPPADPSVPMASELANSSFQNSTIHPASPPSSYLNPPTAGNRGKSQSKKKGTAFWLILIFAGVALLAICVLAAIGILYLMPAPEEIAEAFNQPEQRLLEAREGRKTQLSKFTSENEPPDQPPSELFDVVQFETSIGPMSAYLSVDPEDGEKHPAIIWLFGGFSNGIGSTAWERAPSSNDQSASAYRKQGMVMMYPSLRGSCGNPGHFECMYGEVNDVLDAAKFLAKQPFVDKDKIYVGGHSTGGTLALLCAASSDQFAGCVALGPVDNVSGYGQGPLPFSILDNEEVKFRSPIFWQHGINCPTWIIEGDRGNSDCARILGRNAEAIGKDNIRVFIANGFDHFNIVALANQRLSLLLIGKADESSLQFNAGTRKGSFE